MSLRTTFISWLAFLVAAWVGSRIGLALIQDIRDSGTVRLPEDSAGIRALGFAVVWLLVMGLGVFIMMAPWIRKVGLLVRIVSPESGFSETFAERLNLLGRWVISGCFFLLVLLEREFGFFWLFPALIILLPEFFHLASSGFTGFIDALFFPGSREKKPPYTLKLARFYVQKQRWDDAEAEYVRMLSFYPHELEAWLESLRVAFAQGENADPTADEILSKGLKKLKSPADKDALFATFNAREKPVIVAEPEDF